MSESENLSEILFKPHQQYLETSLISNSGCPLPGLDEIKGKELVEFGFNPHWYRPINRFEWTYLGGNLLDIDEALAQIATSSAERTRPELLDTVQIYGPGNWIYEFSAIAQKRVMLAKECAESGDHERAAHHYRMASRYFAIAAYPNLKGDTLASQAALLCRQAYRHIFEQSSTCGHYSEESFTVRKVKVQGFLHSPDNSSLHPCIIMVGRYEQTATDFFRLFNDYLRPEGFAIFVVDMPGMGSCQALTLDQNCSEVLEAAIDHLSNHVPYVDHTALGVMASGIGCMCAARTALMHPKLIKAMVLNNPQIDNLFVSKEILERLPLCLRSSIANRMEADASSWDYLMVQLQTLSLKKQGLLSMAHPCPVPILAMGSKTDPLTAADLHLLQTYFKDCKVVDARQYVMTMDTFKILKEETAFFKEKLG